MLNIKKHTILISRMLIMAFCLNNVSQAKALSNGAGIVAGAIFGVASIVTGVDWITLWLQTSTPSTTTKVLIPIAHVVLINVPMFPGSDIPASTTPAPKLAKAGWVGISKTAKMPLAVEDWLILFITDSVTNTNFSGFAKAKA